MGENEWNTADIDPLFALSLRIICPSEAEKRGINLKLYDSIKKTIQLLGNILDVLKLKSRTQSPDVGAER